MTADDPRLTAYALNELSQAERRAIETELKLADAVNARKLKPFLKSPPCFKPSWRLGTGPGFCSQRHPPRRQADAGARQLSTLAATRGVSGPLFLHSLPAGLPWIGK